MKMQNWLVMAAVAAALGVSANTSLAQQDNSGGGARQGRGNFDPAQMQQRMLERYKETLEVTNDDEWKALEPRIQKVMDARREAFAGMARGMFGGRRGGGADAAQADQPRRGFGAPSPEAEALQKAIDAKAPKAELKAALDKYVASRKAKQAELEAAQAELRKVLTARQEAIATLNGLL